MEYSLSLSDNKDYVVLTGIGDLTTEKSMAINEEAHIFGKSHGINKFFVDFTKCRNIDSVINNYEFAYNDMPNNEIIDKYAVVAVLVDPNDNSHNFIEVVTSNSGLLMKLFRNKEEAIEYLNRF